MIENSKKIIELVDEVKLYRMYKKKLDDSLSILDNQFRNKIINERNYKEKLKDLLKNKSRDEWKVYFNSYIWQLLEQISILNSKNYDEMSQQELKIPIPVRVSKKSPEFFSLLKEQVKEPKEEIRKAPIPEIVGIDKKTKLKYLNDLGVSKVDIQNFLRSQKIKGIKIAPKVKYTIYQSTFFAKISNVLFDKLTNIWTPLP